MSDRRSRLLLGTRRSPLALAQSGLVARALERLHPGLEVELVPIVTRGDVTPGDLAEVGGKGLFTAELEQGLLDGSLDLAVHSLKDLPVVLPNGLTISSYPERGDARDVLISDVATSLDELPQGARLLTGSLRRRAQLLRHRPDLEIGAIRGNVDTRIRKWRESGAAGVVLAAAGLDRLGENAPRAPSTPLPPELFIPAPGQGTLALQTRSEGQPAELCAALNHPATELAARAERWVVAAFGADCTLPLAAWCRPAGGADGYRISTFLASPDGRHWVADESSHPDAMAAAELSVERLRRHGANALLVEVK